LEILEFRLVGDAPLTLCYDVSQRFGEDHEAGFLTRFMEATLS